MRGQLGVLALPIVLVFLGIAGAAPAEAADCPNDSRRAGTGCIDKYEASVWQIKPLGAATSLSKEQRQVVDRIRNGDVTLADLNKIGALQLGTFEPNTGFVSNGCPDSGKGCTNVYAVSIPGVKPSAGITWFQAAAAARNSYKRLPTNAEWTAAALGTPDSVGDDGLTDCNTVSGPPAVIVNTGSRSKCVSDTGAVDMVGNLTEWVADWVPRGEEPAGGCANNAWYTGGGFDGHGYQCLLGATTSYVPTQDPAALWRGGGAGDGVYAGVMAISGLNSPSVNDYTLGFRAVR